MTGHLGPKKRVTQQDIARMIGVSQATVSLVLNGRADGEVKIAPETRERVLQAIAETGYVADPVARRLAAGRNRILGVFTYEPVFPSANSDFYHPFLTGMEQRAEQLGCDLLLLTSVPVVDGHRRIFNEGNRLRLADGCVLLGRSLDPQELARLIAEELPFASVGRRDDAGGPVPYVGADYPAVVASLVDRAVTLGHRRLAYIGDGDGPESYADRLRGFTTAAAAHGVDTVRERVADRGLDDVLGTVLAAGATVLFVEEYADAVPLVRAARARDLSVPGDLSVVTLGDPTRPASRIDLEFTGFRIPRAEMGSQAVDVLMARIEGSGVAEQRLLPCEPVDGETLTAPEREA